MSNPDDEPPVEETPKAPALGLMSRRLHTFGSPDLEVAVGKTERLYRYHALILASQSHYVDTLLSSPAAKREQEKWRISFPEIEVETWEKMIKHLEPGRHPNLDDLQEIIPFYDKFQFHDGLRYCDFILSKYYIPVDKELTSYGGPDHSYIQKLSRLVSFVHQLNSFPLSRPLAAQWAARCLKRFHCVDEEMIRQLMPLVQNDDQVIKSMVSTYLGRKCNGMTMNEMRDLIETKDFPENCILRCHQINEIDEHRGLLNVETLMVSGCVSHPQVNGEYGYQNSSEFQKEYGSEFAVSHKGGAASGCWRKMENCGIYARQVSSENIVVESLDVFGSVWEIYQEPMHDSDDERSIEGGSENRIRRVFLRWEDGISTRLIPPKYGWKVIDERGDAVTAAKIRIDYSIVSKGFVG